MSDPVNAEDIPPTCPVAMGEIIDGKYRVDKAIAFGGMGVVCAATHVELETQVAIKLVRPELASNADATSRFLNEAKAAAGLKGEHVARVIDFGTLPSGAPYMVMEYLQGSDLWSMIANHGPLPVATAADYVLQACEALAEAHAAHIIHRDVKPENLFLTERPDGTSSIKVLDFGISKQLTVDRQLTNPNNGLGSPYYMSPEQMCSPSEVDARTDIWSMGCVLYVLLTGQLPFYCESIAGVCAKVLNERPPSLRALRTDVSQELESIIFRCLRKDRRERFEDVAELARALAPFGSADARQCITRVQRILARSSDPPPRDTGNSPVPLVHVAPAPVPASLAAPAAAPYRLSYEPETRPRIQGVVQSVAVRGAPIPVVPLVRRRPVRRVARPRPAPRSRVLRHLAIATLALIAGGGAVLGARALGYELPPVGDALFHLAPGSEFRVQSAQPSRVTQVNELPSSATTEGSSEAAQQGAGTTGANEARPAGTSPAPAATHPTDSRFPTTPIAQSRSHRAGARHAAARKIDAPAPEAAAEPAEGEAPEAVESNAEYRRYLSALRPPGGGELSPIVPEEYREEPTQQH